MRKIAISGGLVLGSLLIAQSAMGQKPTADESATAIAAIREYALNYTNSLPNFTCLQVVHHQLNPVRRAPGLMVGAKAQNDLIEQQLSFVDHRELHQVLRINGFPPQSDTQRNEAVSSWGEFGNLLSAVMDPITKTEFKMDRVATLNGKKVYVVNYFIEQPNGYVILAGEQIIRAPYHGQIYADYDTKAVLRLRADIGPIADYQEMNITLDYKPITVAAKEFLLPSHYALHVRKPEYEVSNDSDYKSYKRFGTESTLIFDTELEDAPPQR
jgi:hypothetical protein